MENQESYIVKGNEEFEQVKQKIKLPELSINRVPKNTLSRFFELCSMEDFSGDRGMLLKYLIDFHDGIILHGNEIMQQQIETLNQRVTQLEEEMHKPKPTVIKSIKTLSGEKLGGVGDVKVQ